MAIRLRTTTGGPSGAKEQFRTPGAVTGVGLNTYVLDKIESALDGPALAKILMRAISIAKGYALQEWPVVTGASRDTIRTQVSEVSLHAAKVSLLVGGPQLIADERNKSKKDYAPYVEFNGTSRTPPGTILRSMEVNKDAMRESIREDVAELLRRSS